MDKSGIKTDFLRVGLGVAILTFAVGTCRAEVNCYRTPAQAAVQVGEQEGGGYRLEFVRADAFGHRRWASVRSCAHPEWPAVIVSTLEVVQSHPGFARVGHPDVSPMVVMGGRQVRVVLADAVTRMEMTGVVQSSGRIGDTVRVRILAPGDGGEGRVLEAVVRGADVLEIGR